MQLIGECSSSTRTNGLLKVLFTVINQPTSHDEYVLLNLLKSRGGFKSGKTYRITIEEE
jgi:hypothetical protein